MFRDYQRLLRQEEVSHAGVPLVQIVLVEALLFASVFLGSIVSALVKVETQAWMTAPTADSVPQAHLLGVGG